MAVYLNDKYFLDGRDPDGYAGIAWAIAGKVDRPWFERPIFGMIRYISGNAARKKFDADKYIEQMRDPGGGLGRGLRWPGVERLRRDLQAVKKSAGPDNEPCDAHVNIEPSLELIVNGG